MKSPFLSSVSLVILLVSFPSASDAQWAQTNLRGSADVAVAGTNVFALSDSGIFLSTNNGTSWTLVNSSLKSFDLHSIAAIGTNLFAGTEIAGVFLSTNDGTTWTEVDSGMSDLDVQSLAVNGTTLLAGDGDGFSFRSTNNGLYWTKIGSGFPQAPILSFVASGKNLFAGAGYVGMGYGGGVCVSSDSGTSWKPAGLSHVYVWSLAVIGSKIFAGTDGAGVFLSTDNGANWSSVNSGPTLSRIQCFAVLGTELVAGTDSGRVFVSSDNGTTWREESSGLPNSIVYRLAISDTNLIAGTGDGVFMRPLSQMITSVHVLSAEPPDIFDLEQNYPNPFNPSTTIRYALPQRAHATLTVFNTLGQQVATLVNEIQEAGYHDVRFDGSGLASGVYFYRLTAGDFVQTKKLLILR